MSFAPGASLLCRGLAALYDREQEAAMSEPMHFDLVAIGGGFAGLCAAVRGAELGLHSAVIEAGSDDGYLCSSAGPAGSFTFPTMT
jgi:heterodisulfide reductase subunit A-like polyferredoxin